MKYSYTFLGLAALASANDFTSIYNVTATPYEVINNAGQSAPGPYGAKGQYNYAINSKTDTICYDITLEGVVGDYLSPAKTATHIHEGAKGKAGPPRLALPNPVGDEKYRHVSGCMTGPFTTGLKMADNVTDTGAGFKLSQIEANPAGFFTDSHTVLYPAGVVRGQLDYKFEIIKKPDGYPQGPEYPATTKKQDGHETTKKPEPTKYPEHPEHPTTKKDDHMTTKKDDGHEITTATITKTHEITISSCKEEVTDCPYKTKPVVTKTEEVYTTVCPKSEVTKHYPPKTEKTDKHESTKTYTTTYAKQTTETKYETVTITKPGETHPVYETKTIKTEYPVETTETKYETVTKPVETHPVYETKTNEGKPSKPVETHPVETHPVVTYPVHGPSTTVHAPIGTGTGYPKATPTYEFTGAAGSNKVGGLLIAAGLAAALL